MDVGIQIAILQIFGNGRQRSPARHVTRGRQTLQTHGFPVQTYG